MTPIRDDTVGERGFTLIELLVSMTLALIVLFAILQASDVFARLSGTATADTVAQNAARDTVRTMVTTLRQARVATGETTPIPATWAASRRDLVVAAYVTSAVNSAPGSTPGWVRYCASTSGAVSSLVVGVRVGDTYVPPGPCAAGSVANGWSHAVMVNRTLQAPTMLFDFTSSTCVGGACLPDGPAVQAVGIRVAIGTRDDGSTSFNSVVRDAVSFRNRGS